MKAKAKHDVKVLMEDNRFSNFLKGKEYRCMNHGDNMILIDENKSLLKDLSEDYEEICSVAY